MSEQYIDSIMHGATIKDLLLALTLNYCILEQRVFYVYMVPRILKTTRDYCPNSSLLTGLCNGDISSRLNTLGYEAMQLVNCYRRFGCTCFHYLQGRGDIGAGLLLLLCLSVSQMLRHFDLRNVTICQLAQHHISEDWIFINIAVRTEPRETCVYCEERNCTFMHYLGIVNT